MPQLIIIEGREEQRRQLAEQLAAFEKKGCTLAGKFDVNGTFTSWRALFENAVTPGLFETGRQVIVAEGCDALGAFPDELAAALEGDESSSVIIAMFNAANVTTGAKSGERSKEQGNDDRDDSDNKKNTGTRSSVFSKDILALGKIIIIKAEAKNMSPWGRRSWLSNFARDNGWKITTSAVQLLGDSIESTEELRTELRKLVSYAGHREITVEDVRTLSFDEGASAQLEFLDGVCKGDAYSVAHALKHLKRNSALLIVLTSIVNRLRPALIMILFSGNQSDAALAAVGVQDQSKHAVIMAKNALALYGQQAIKNFMIGALRLSYREKTSLAEGWAGFELLLWGFMSGAHHAARDRGRPSHNYRDRTQRR